VEFDDPSLPPFEPILLHLHETAHTGGISALERIGKQLEDIQGDRSLLRVFVRGCHYGYDLAQKHIAERVIEMERETRELSNQLKAFRRERSPEARPTFRRIRVLRNRQIALRRIVDSILYAVIKGENWLLRRLNVDLTIHSIDPDVVDRTVKIAAERNRENRLKFSIVSDLTTVVQIGDLIEIDMTTEGRGSWRVVELKEGHVNELLAGLIEQGRFGQKREGRKPEDYSLGQKAIKQAQRMVRQRSRVSELERIIETDRGLDPVNQVETFMTPDVVALENYYVQLKRVHEDALKNGIAAMESSGCLRVLAFTSEKARGKPSAVAAHVFFHLANPGRACAFEGGSAECQLEERTQVGSVPYFVDIADYNLNVPIADPIFSWPDRDMVMDLVTGRVYIFVQLDMLAFLNFARSRGIQIDLLQGKRAKESKGESMRWPGSADVWGMEVKFEGQTRVSLLSGFFARVFANLATPLQLVTMIEETPEKVLKFVQSSNPKAN
jgi:hypothetical protein